MDTAQTIVHSILAVLLFIITNWVGKHSLHAGYLQLSVLVKADEAPAFNFVYRVFSPIAFITIASAILYKAGADWAVKDIYRVVVYYFTFRLFFIAITGRARLLNWYTQFAYILVSVPFAYYVYEQLILHREFLFPSPKELGNAIWLGIAAYLYHTANSVRFSGERAKSRKRSYLVNRFEYYRERYGTIIEEIAETKQQGILIYAVLIYETFNRPRLYRLIENLLFHAGLAKTLGPMQVTTDVFISDEDSVRLGARKIVNDHQAALFKLEEEESKPYSWSVRRAVLSLYNRDDDYVREVEGIYEQLIEAFLPEEKDKVLAELQEHGVQAGEPGA